MDKETSLVFQMFSVQLFVASRLYIFGALTLLFSLTASSSFLNLSAHLFWFSTAFFFSRFFFCPHRAQKSAVPPFDRLYCLHVLRNNGFILLTLRDSWHLGMNIQKPYSWFFWSPYLLRCCNPRISCIVQFHVAIHCRQCMKINIQLRGKWLKRSTNQCHKLINK